MTIMKICVPCLLILKFENLFKQGPSTTGCLRLLKVLDNKLYILRKYYQLYCR
jgi:hypothetical protein